MKKLLFSLLAGLLITAVGYGQASPSQSDGYYSVPVPTELKTTTVSRSTTGQLTVKQVKREKANYKVQIQFDSKSKKEAVYSLGVISDNSKINMKLSDLSSPIAKPVSISTCYFNNKKMTPDWQTLANCTVNYVQAFL